MSLSMKELPSEERPYEKCMLLGASSLNDAELLAVIFRTGRRGANSVELARQVIVSSGGSLGGLYDLSYRDFMKIPGIGRVKAVQLECLKILSNRMVKSASPVRTDFTRADAVFHRYAGEMRAERQEIVKVLFLNTKCMLIRELTVSRGTVNASVIPVREIFVEALKAEAVFLIVMHNHPSGDPAPSKEDLEVTKKIEETGHLTGIRLLDHLIFGDTRYVSLRERGWIK